MSITPAQRQANAINGLCTRCRTAGCSAFSPRLARPGRRSCTECADAHSHKEAKASRKRKRHGLCPCGGKRRYGRLTCQECAEAKEIKRREVEVQLVADGICVKCRVNPARERKPNKRPKDKRIRKNAGARAVACSRRYLTLCGSCSDKQKRREKAKVLARKSKAQDQRA